VYDISGNVRLPGLDNHAMGTIFEELIRRFNEENNEEAGEHFTPRDVIYLMADLIFLPISESVESGTYLVYDGACGTGGMLTIAEERLKGLAQAHGKEVSIHLYGQEVNSEIYAINKADLLLKGEGEEAENILHASTLSKTLFQTGNSISCSPILRMVHRGNLILIRWEGKKTSSIPVSLSIMPETPNIIWTPAPAMDSSCF
jgi:type I restriction enzyme M protein